MSNSYRGSSQGYAVTSRSESSRRIRQPRKTSSFWGNINNSQQNHWLGVPKPLKLDPSHPKTPVPTRQAAMPGPVRRTASRIWAEVFFFCQARDGNPKPLPTFATNSKFSPGRQKTENHHQLAIENHHVSWVKIWLKIHGFSNVVHSKRPCSMAPRQQLGGFQAAKTADPPGEEISPGNKWSLSMKHGG